MKKERFSKPQALRFGWDVWRNNIGFFIKVLLIVLLVQVVSGLVSVHEENKTSLLMVFVNIFYNVVGIIISMGFVKISLGFCDGKKPEIGDLFNVYPLFFIFLLGSIFYGLIVLGGFLLLIIPGIILGIQFQFFSYFIIDQKAGPIEALKKSARLTRGVKFELFIFNMMVLGINLLGIFALFVGVLITMPVTMVASAFVYRKLLETAQPQGSPEALPI